MHAKSEKYLIFPFKFDNDKYTLVKLPNYIHNKFIGFVLKVKMGFYCRLLQKKPHDFFILLKFKKDSDVESALHVFKMMLNMCVVT
jgi:hypothetical protein